MILIGMKIIQLIAIEIIHIVGCSKIRMVLGEGRIHVLSMISIFANLIRVKMEEHVIRDQVRSVVLTKQHLAK